LINAATRELYRLRADLVHEIRTDDDERAVRVDRMLAELKARRAVEAEPLRDGDAASCCFAGRWAAPKIPDKRLVV
jgi:hypothetical protein